MKTKNQTHTPATPAHTPGPIGRSPLNWLVVNQSGKLLAVLDSESEAHFFTKNRGHASGAVYFKAACDYAAAPELLEALDSALRQLEYIANVDREDATDNPILIKFRAAIARATEAAQ